MLLYELFTPNIKFITGVDEVGRGALAGPLLSGAVGITRKFIRLNSVKHWSEKINDSKKITEQLRNELNIAIRENFPYGIGIVSVGELNSWGLTRANQVAMRRAMENLPKADLIIGDGRMLVPRSFTEFRPIIKADTTIWPVAAASIVAKVTRDKIMRDFHQQYPQYGFDRHVGYGTKFHREAILRYGPCPIHRTCFKLV